MRFQAPGRVSAPPVSKAGKQITDLAKAIGPFRFMQMFKFFQTVVYYLIDGSLKCDVERIPNADLYRLRLREQRQGSGRFSFPGQLFYEGYFNEKGNISENSNDRMGPTYAALFAKQPKLEMTSDAWLATVINAMHDNDEKVAAKAAGNK